MKYIIGNRIREFLDIVYDMFKDDDINLVKIKSFIYKRVKIIF